ncbi:MAG TPA: pinensin family lanthipeptide [Chitinophaga sp.]|uniref:pinensin family lanthipeptide n=1 Tax=Chitinophaga sp. TaxID=1869181 RepID=UPI002CD9FDD4|nr:pinensin family lanthipeptide [Chitinophaga sp.]HVI48735.1 pinensin family lanthipeptide [Chitinophaga sp.]
MKNNSERIKLNLDDLQLESFVTSIDSEMAARLSGGVGSQAHPTHTQPTDTEHNPPIRCTTVIC